jgi:hypothetical protein
MPDLRSGTTYPQLLRFISAVSVDVFCTMRLLTLLLGRHAIQRIVSFEAKRAETALSRSKVSVDKETQACVWALKTLQHAGILVEQATMDGGYQAWTMAPADASVDAQTA